MKKAFAVTVGWIVFALIFCPGISAGPVPDTGQTGCYNDQSGPVDCANPGGFAGQDANYNEINQPSYTKLDAEGKPLTDDATEWAMVLDNVTGLIWEAKQKKDGTEDYDNPNDADNKYTWYDSTLDADNGQAGEIGEEGKNTEEFIKKLNEKKFGGFSDWRLPTIKELAFIVDKDTYEPGLYKNSGNVVFFPNVKYDTTNLIPYWSSTSDPEIFSYSQKYDLVFGVDFRYGKVDKTTKSRPSWAMAVSGSSLQAALIENEDGKTVTDRSTGLVWQKEKADAATSWQGALTYCQERSLADHDDWRLPSVNELLSLVDYKNYKPAVNSMLKEHTESVYYWSSTSQLMSTVSSIYEPYKHACVVDFSNGRSAHQVKSSSYNIRAVRGPLPVSELFGLVDAIVCLQIAAGFEFGEADKINFYDVDGDGKMGVREASWALQIVAETRTGL